VFAGWEGKRGGFVDDEWSEWSEWVVFFPLLLVIPFVDTCLVFGVWSAE